MTNLLNEEKPPRWFVALMAVIITIAVMMALSSCSSSQIANRKLQRADRLINEAKALGVEVKVDTIYAERVIPGKDIRVEVPVEKLIRYDSIIYEKGEVVKIPVSRWVKRDTTVVKPDYTLYLKWGKGGLLDINVKVKPDTIEIPITVHESIVCPDCPKDKFWKGFGMGVGLLLILLIILAVVRAIRG